MASLIDAVKRADLEAHRPENTGLVDLSFVFLAYKIHEIRWDDRRLFHDLTAK